MRRLHVAAGGVFRFTLPVSIAHYSGVRDTIQLDNGQLRALILPFGATLSGLWRSGDPRSLVLGFVDPADHQRQPIFAGPIVGPVANRIRKGTVRIADTLHHMPRNERGQVTLHSGPEGLHRRKWQAEAQSRTAVRLTVTLLPGDCGLPGTREIAVQYRLVNTTLEVTLTARSDAPTVMNLAHHPYWAVSAKARLRVSAEHYLPVGDDKLPTGEVQRVARTAFDLRRPVPIPGHLDHNYILSKSPTALPRRAAWLTMPHYALHLETTAPGLQVYSGAGLPSVDRDKALGWPIGPHTGLALEPQFWPDAPHHAHFPSILLQPGEIWTQSNRYILNF